MFCKNCGKRIDTDLKCACCGKIAVTSAKVKSEMIEAVLLEGDRTPQFISVDSSNNIDALNKKINVLGEKYNHVCGLNRKYVRTITILKRLTAILAILCLILSIRVFVCYKNSKKPLSETNETTTKETIKTNDQSDIIPWLNSIIKPLKNKIGIMESKNLDDNKNTIDFDDSVTSEAETSEPETADSRADSVTSEAETSELDTAGTPADSVTSEAEASEPDTAGTPANSVTGEVGTRKSRINHNHDGDS